ncbi:type I glutamate--ammonia ligase [Candidatus Gottesmanbacteria bacterium]|nr:type I glutamate--ammonia ligase [Candidatus Gottesmanbacteria bacterium]
MTFKEIKSLIKSKELKIVDLKFVDPRGVWQHASIPPSAFDEGAAKEGIGFDGSSIKGFQEIHESDMLLLPDLATAHVDPFYEIPTLSLICDVYDPDKKEPFTRDPRNVAKKAEKYLVKSGVADKSYWGPEAEFFVFNHLSYDIKPYKSGFSLDSIEAPWNSGNESETNTQITIRPKEGYFPVPPQDTLQDLRSEMVNTMEAWNIPIEMHHHEVAAPGQCEIDMRYDNLLKMADNVLIYKYVVKNVAKKYGKVVSFMPKPVFGDNGSGMHTHQSLWKNGKNLFYDENGWAELSKTALYYIGGLLTHIDALLAFCAPTTNSYRRLVPHYEAPVNVAFSKRNRSAAVRIPMYFSGPKNSKSKRIEFRPPDTASNPYLTFSALLMAGLDGIKNKIDPVKSGFGPLDKNIYELSAEDAKKVRSVPGSLTETLNALEKDNKFLLEGGVFTPDFLDMWVSMKRTEQAEVAIRPTPYEFYLYADM